MQTAAVCGEKDGGDLRRWDLAVQADDEGSQEVGPEQERQDDLRHGELAVLKLAGGKGDQGDGDEAEDEPEDDYEEGHGGDCRFWIG